MKRVFITGASGFVASLIIPELLSNNYEILGLTRSKESAIRISDLGVKAIIGDITDLKLLNRISEKVDAIIHLAFDFNSNNMQKTLKDDLNAIDTFISVLKETNKTLITTTGLMGISTKPGKLILETNLRTNDVPRGKAENKTITADNYGIRGIAIRLPVVIHGEKSNQGFIPKLKQGFIEVGESFYLNNADSNWSGISQSEIGIFYRLALEKAPAGSILHAVNDTDKSINLKEIVSTISNKYNLPTKEINETEANKFWGDFTRIIVGNFSMDNSITKEVLGWSPGGNSLLKDIKTYY